MIQPKQIIRSSRKSLALTINERGELIVHASKNMPLYEIVDYISKKSDWIEKKVSKISDVVSKNRDIIDYNEIFFLGKRYRVVETSGIENPYLTQQTIMIKPTKSITKKQNMLKKWFIDNIDTVLLPRVQKLADFMKQKYRSVSIINSKAKWGMCDSKRNIFFNWKLLMLSPELIDYVIVHEISHLIELNHSTKFWKIVGVVIPKYKHIKEVLNRCGFLIKLF